MSLPPLPAWPPPYDAFYRPPVAAEYWRPELECAEPAERDRHILDKLRHQLRWAWERSPFSRR